MLAVLSFLLEQRQFAAVRMSVENGPMGLFDAIYSVSNSGGSSSASSISGNESPSHGNYPAFEDFSNFTFGDDAEDMSSIDDGPTMTGGKESTCMFKRKKRGKSICIELAFFQLS